MARRIQSPRPLGATTRARPLRLLHKPSAVFEVRALHVPGRGKPHTEAGYFDDAEKAADAAIALDKRKPAGIYVTLNPVDAALLARSPNIITPYLEPTTSDGDVTGRLWLPLDFDAKRPSGISSTEAEQQAALDAARWCRDWLTGEGWPLPVFGSSGNGGHLLYRVELPNTEEVTGIAQAAIEAVAAAVEREHGERVEVDRKVFNPARIWRLYGTVARKGHDMPERPHRRSELVDVPAKLALVPVETLRELAATLKDSESDSHTGRDGRTYGDHRLDVPKWLAARGVAFRVKDRPDRFGRTVYILERCPFDEGHGGNGEVSIMQGPDGKLGAACMHNSCTSKGWQEFRDAIGRPEPEHWDPPLGRRHRDNGEGGPSVDESPVEPSARRPEKRRFRHYSMAELDALDLKEDYLLRHALVTGTPGVIGGREKTLKTLIALDCGISVATFTPWLGHFEPVRSTSVVYFVGEGGLTVVRDYARRVAAAKGFALKDVRQFYICDEVPTLNSDRDIQAAIDTMTDTEAELVFFDPLYLMLTGDAKASNVYAMGALFARMLRACLTVGVTPILLHHFQKSWPVGEAPQISALSQAGISEFVGQWLLANRLREYDEEQPGKHDLIIRLGSRVGFSSGWAVHVEEGRVDDESGRYWQPTVTVPSEARRQAAEQRKEVEADREERALKDARKAIVKVMAKLRKPHDRASIADRTCIKRQRFNAAWASLVDDGGVVEAGSVTKGNRQSYPTYKLGEDR